MMGGGQRVKPQSCTITQCRSHYCFGYLIRISKGGVWVQCEGKGGLGWGLKSWVLHPTVTQCRKELLFNAAKRKTAITRLNQWKSWLTHSENKRELKKMCKVKLLCTCIWWVSVSADWGQKRTKCIGLIIHSCMVSTAFWEWPACLINRLVL